MDLRPFEREQLRLVEPWFQDVETWRWLGGPDWPRAMLDIATRPLGTFRGAVEIARLHWLAWQDAVAVGYIDCGIYDRWTTWEGGPAGRGVLSSIDLPAAAIAYVVDPSKRRRGLGSAMIRALTAHPDLNGIELFGAGVEPENVASVRTLEKAGFRALASTPDFEGMIYFAWWRVH